MQEEKGARHSPIKISPTKQRNGIRIPIKRCSWATFEKMGKKTQVGHTPTPSENTYNKTITRIERSSSGGRHRNVTRRKINSGVPKIFKGSLPEVGAMLGTKDK